MLYEHACSDADAVGRAHKEIFGNHEPAATMVVVAALLDPTWRVEIEVEAIVSNVRPRPTSRGPIQV